MWSGIDGHLYVCTSCALTSLPALIADAVWSPHLTYADALRSLADITTVFWRVLTLHYTKLRDGRAQ
jgi:hypothetical protein